MCRSFRQCIPACNLIWNPQTNEENTLCKGHVNVQTASDINIVNEPNSKEGHYTVAFFIEALE